MFKHSFTIAKTLAALALLAQGCAQPYSVAILPSPAYFELVTAPSQLAATGPTNIAKLLRLENLALGKTPFGAVSKYSLYVRNQGDLPGILKDFSIQPPSVASNFTVTSTCSTLGGNNTETCPFQVSFSPTVLGDINASLVINYDDGKGTIKQLALPLQGSASNLAFLRFDPPTLDLGTDTVGYTVSATLNVIYNGAHFSGAFAIKPAMGVTVSDPTNSQFTIDRAGTTCGTVINADCVIKLNFAATSVGAKTANLDLTYFNGSESLKITAGLQGTGLAGVVLASLSASSGAFGNVVFNPAAPKVVPIQVTFSGSIPADNVVITAPSGPAFTLSTNPLISTCYANPTTINGNCILSVSFNPTARQAYSDSMKIAYKSNGQVRGPLNIPLSGNGVNPAVLTITPAASPFPQIDFGLTPAHYPKNNNFVLKNTGEAPVSGLSAITLSDSVNYKSTLDTSCATLAANTTCNLRIDFVPLSAKNMPSAVSFTYFDGRVTKPVSLSILGTGTAPAYMNQPNGNSIDFGNVLMGAAGSNYTTTVTLGFYGTTLISSPTNLKSTPPSLNSPFQFLASGTFPGGGTCAPVLNPAAANSCTFKLGLSTTSAGLTAGIQTTQPFTVHYEGDGGDPVANGSGDLSFTAKMTPQLPPVLIFDTPPNSFGTLAANDSKTLNFTVRNTSPYFATSNLSALLSGSTAPYTVSNGCSGGVAANSTCTISVTFKPTAAQTYAATLTYNYNDGLAAQSISTNFSGTGSGDVRIAVNGSTTVDFGTVYLGDTIPTKSVSLSYFGLNNWTPSYTAGAPFSVNSSDCGTARNCSLVVSFAPSAAGTFNVSVPVSYSPGVDPPNSNFTLTLKGVVVSRSVNLSGSNLSFSKTLVNSSLDRTVVITNNGSASASSLSFSLGAGPFSIKPGVDASAPNPCTAVGLVLASGQSCQIRIHFAPTQSGAVTASLGLNYHDNGLGTNPNTSFTLSGIGTVPIQIFAGAFQTCMINELQQVVCWGNNAYGQLGQGNTSVMSTAPQNIPKINLGALSQVKKLAVGAHHVCAIVDTPSRIGIVSCWGENSNGRLGLGSATAQVSQPQLDGSGYPIPVNLGTDTSAAPYRAVEISAGFEHTCAILHDGKVKCWGGNSNGQLGIGNTSNIGSSTTEMGNNLAAVNLQGGSATAISAGAGHTCAVLSDGSAKCWGDNEFGQLGQGTHVSPIGSAPADMAALPAIHLGSGAQAAAVTGSPSGFTCVTLTTGAVKCFGHAANDPSDAPFYGVLGACWGRTANNSPAVACSSDPLLFHSNSLGYYPTDMGDNLPAVALNGLSVVKLASGGSFSCALLSDQTVRCWGLNDRGQLGNGGNNNVGANPSEMGSALAATLPGSPGAFPTSVAAGNEHACATLSDNTVKCWGSSNENATGLKSVGVSGDVNSAASAQIIYDGKI